MAKTISFVDNVQGRHGDVLRSSAIFYYVRNSQTKTTLSLLNYWPIKRNLQVAVVASLRRMDGTLVRRERLSFQPGMVCNYAPALDEPFEGSAEIEVFSVENLVVPYAAVMAIYETAKGIAQVHSYGRTYSRHEVEEGRAIAAGSEGCWTLRDDGKRRSFAVFHNGGAALAEQVAEIEVIGAGGERRRKQIPIPALEPYASYKLFAEQAFPDLARFLNGRPGSASIKYRTAESFVRMLVGVEARDGTDMQVTHSNFDYRAHSTDFVPGQAKGYMVVPALSRKDKRVVIYPHSAEGRYKVGLASTNQELTQFRSGELLQIELGGGSDTLVFERVDGEFPSRLVTSLLIDENPDVLPNECSLGILQKLQPRKRFWWGPCVSSPQVASKLVLHDLPEIYGGMPAAGTVQLTLYSPRHQEQRKTVVPAKDLAAFESGVDFADLFPDCASFLDGGFGYYTLFHEYGGLTAYSYFRKDTGSVCLEHGF
jgi:hypothetical protein